MGNCNSGYQSPKCSGPSGTSENELRVFPKALESEFMQCQEKTCLQFTNVSESMISSGHCHLSIQFNLETVPVMRMMNINDAGLVLETANLYF